MIKLVFNKLKNYQPKLYILLIFLAIIFLTTLSVNAILLANRVSGYIVLDVENHGEAWYVFPNNNIRYYLGRPSDSFEIMRSLSVGVSNKDLSKIPIGILYSGSLDTDGDELSDDLEKAIGTDLNKVDTDGDGYSDRYEIEAGYNPLGSGEFFYDNNLIERVAGRILLQVEGHGEAWYISPETKKRYYLGRPRDAFWIMRNLGLGITHSDLEKITPNVNLNVNSNSLISVPQDYEECASLQSNKILNKLSCWWIPKDRSGINKCREVDNHWSGAEAECALVYHNSDFVFPESLKQCMAMDESNMWQNSNETICNMVILNDNISSEENVNHLQQSCPGIYSQNIGCIQMFRSYARPILSLPNDYVECVEIAGSFPKDSAGDDYICLIMLNKVDYPLLYESCIEQGGEYSDKVPGTHGLGEGCSIRFES